MKVKAIVSFAGVETMAPGDVKDVSDALAQGLIEAGYAEPVEAQTSTGNEAEPDEEAGEAVEEHAEEPVENPDGRPEEQEPPKARKRNTKK